MDIQRIKELALANGFKLKEQVSGNMDLNAYVYDFANAIEQEVRVQADQKVKLLLCDEHLKKCESPTGIFNSQYPDEEPCLICLAKEAKAQVVPEVVTIGNELQSWVAVHSFAAKDGNDIVCAVDANALAEEIEKLTGANA
ncbi:hypothetical protein [Acinetobacter indicus]|uniref:hypothetical protein n=1 Tax=Acinetobacter indicus TaxID=756892 RepID=UPI002576FC5E|nr:hypothetical protein [Acinetobacter indicus]MDM1771071.1 hypothetical protein [Acinetobacter indicus]MDM1773737.1 hypothetical protein [Acinetobacter indicus]